MSTDKENKIKLFNNLGDVNYTDLIQLDGAFYGFHIKYGKSPNFNSKNLNLSNTNLKKENVTNNKNIDETNVFEIKGIETDYSTNDKIELWKNYWLEYINAFNKLTEILPESIVTIFIGRHAIELGIKYLLISKNIKIENTHDLGSLIDVFLKNNDNLASYMNGISEFCHLYTEYIESNYVEYFRFPDYKGKKIKSFFAGNLLDIKWVSYNMAIILLKLLHFANLESEFINN